MLVGANAPHVHAAIRIAFSVLWFTSPFFASSFALSFVYIFLLRPRAGIERITLPRYPDPAHRSALFLVLGEIHKQRRPTAIDRPRWLTIPRRALFTGIGIFGAVGSGKTTCCMYPFAEQLLAYRHDDPERRIDGLVLEVKGDFCYRVREILHKHGREDDYIERSLDCPSATNRSTTTSKPAPSHTGIASLLTKPRPRQGALLAAGLHQCRPAYRAAAQVGLRLLHALRRLGVRHQSRPSRPTHSRGPGALRTRRVPAPRPPRRLRNGPGHQPHKVRSIR